MLAQKAIILILAGTVLFGPATAWALTPNDSEFDRQGLMWNSIQAPTAWDKTTGSSDVVVAIIDSGVDITNPDLQGNIWINTHEIPANGIDDDHNGFIDDVNGWNFVEENNRVAPPDFQDGDTTSAINHGTQIAGLIGAVGNNGLAGAGLNWQVRLMPLRAIENSGSGNVAGVQRAMEYAVRNGANVVSMSFVGPVDDPELQAAFRRAYDAGVVIVAAAGNDRREGKGDVGQFPLYPLCFDRGDRDNWILGVSSITYTDELSSFANFGACVDLLAPGEHIFSTIPGSAALQGAFRGTSFSAPLAAGAAALLKAVRPDWNASDIIPALLKSADSLASANPLLATQLGAGKLNVSRAVDLALESKPHGRSLDVLYGASGSTLMAYNVATQSSAPLTTLPGAVIGDVVPLPGGQGSGPTLAVLIRRNGYDYVRLISSRGDLGKEFSLTDSDPVLSRAVLKQLRLLRQPDGSSNFVSQQYDPVTKRSVFLIFNNDGIVLKRISVQGALLAWDVAERNNALVMVEQNKKVVVVKQVNLDDGVTSLFNLPAGVTVEAIRAAGLWGGRIDQSLVLVATKRGQERYTVDFATGSFVRETLPGISGRPTVIVGAAPDGQTQIAYFDQKSGQILFTSGRGEILTAGIVPELIQKQIF